MIKLLAETKGHFQLMDMSHLGQMVRAQRPCVVENSNFIQDRIGRDQIRVLSELLPEATDAEFEAYLKESEGDIDLAVDSFLAEYGKEAVVKEGQSAKKPQVKKQQVKAKTEPKAEETKAAE